MQEFSTDAKTLGVVVKWRESITDTFVQVPPIQQLEAILERGRRTDLLPTDSDVTWCRINVLALVGEQFVRNPGLILSEVVSNIHSNVLVKVNMDERQSLQDLFVAERWYAGGVGY